METLRSRPVQAIGWSVAALVASVAVGRWLALDLGPHLRAAWWGLAVGVLVLAGPASALVFLRDMNTWAQAKVTRRKVVVDLGGFVLTTMLTWSIAVYLLRGEGWL